MLKEISRRDDPSIPSDEDLDQIQIPPAEDIEAVITNNLVLFHSTSALQNQNQKLLKIVRELGARMEAEEQEYRAAMEKEQTEAIKEAHEAIKTLTVQLETQQKSSEIKIQAYMKERDALKSLLARAERSSGGSGAGAGDAEAGINGYHEGPSSHTTPDVAKEIAEMQNQFESYRTEMGIDSVKLREEVITAQREAGQLNADLAKAHAKIEYLTGNNLNSFFQPCWFTYNNGTDRYRMSQEQFAMQGRELDSLTKHNQQLRDQYTRVDIKLNRATEDVLEANSRIEQLRNECANLRAEKKIWEVRSNSLLCFIDIYSYLLQSVQSRLVEENKTLAVERSHLSDLMVNVQKMHNDLERSGENDRQRLESQLSMLENQTYVQQLSVFK